jgi:integrase/recombinase XerD
MKNGVPPSYREKAPPSSGAIARKRGTEPQDAASKNREIDLRRAAERWISDGRAQGWSPRTIKDHRQNLGRFAWWLENEEETSATLESLDPPRIRAFLAYHREPHPTGRFGSVDPGARRAARPSSVATYYRDLRAFANFCLAEGLLVGDPFRNVKPPKVPNDQIQPMEREQLQVLLDAARRGRSPERDVALILLLTDSEMRVSELCALTVADADRAPAS